jgi:hypothetical protein
MIIHNVHMYCSTRGRGQFEAWSHMVYMYNFGQGRVRSEAQSCMVHVYGSGPPCTLRMHLASSKRC